MTAGYGREGRALARRRVGVFAAGLGLVAALLLAPAASASSSAAVGQGAVSSSDVSAGIVQTADLTQFQAGNIISDQKFFDRTTMGEAQIQQFLQAKVPTCRSGYVCLKDAYDTSRATSADAMCAAYPGGYRERASTIIAKVAQACGINPQVILVMLEKEQGLVTHTWPSDWRYTIAMGQGCPDTAACDTRYYGFFNQVYGAAWQLKRYANPPGTSQYFTWYAPGKTWNVRFHPDAACGSSPVLIQNQATANLYYYTPYQPNAASIRAGYGEGDGCSSYGNRNFYQHFTDWFGSTQARPAVYGKDPSVAALDDTGSLWAYPFAQRQWGPRVLLASGLRTARAVLPVGDFDGDGARDAIVVDSAGKVTVRAIESDARATARTLNVSWADATQIVAAGDFDGDGMPDVFTTSAAGALTLWSGTGYGAFRGPRVVGTGWQGIEILSAGVDLDGAGGPELVARSADGVLRVYRGDGAGGWGATSTYGGGWQAMRAVVSPGDFTGDGVNDLLATDADGVMWLYRASDGGYVRDGAVGSGWRIMTAIAYLGAKPTGVRVHPGGVGDLDGTGTPDILAVADDGALTVYSGNGRGGFAGQSGVGKVAPGDRVIALGDFTGDGLPDVGVIGADGGFTLRRGNADGTLAAGTSIGQGWSVLTPVLGGIDFDGDRRLDVLARDARGNLLLYRGDGAGGWLTGRGEVVGIEWNTVDALLYPGDFDGDRTPDLLARTPDGRLWLYATDGSGHWRTPRAVGQGWTVMTALFSPGDFDGGGVDVIGRRADGTLVLYQGNGSGGWSGQATIGYGWNGMRQIL